MYRCISAYHFITVLSLLLPCIIILFLTCWVSTISVLNHAIFPCYSNLLLRRRGWTEILRWGVLGYVFPRLSFLWCYEVFRCFVLLRVIIVFRDTTYVIIILYSWHLIICEHFWSYVWNYWSWVMHTMSTWFWHKNWVWQKWYQSHVNRRNASLDRRVIFLVLFEVFAKKIFYSNLSPLFLIYKY
jgi:hypothetical protein